MSKPKVQLYDTTLRDGTQGEGVAFSAEDKLKVAQRLDAFGMDYIEGGWPGSNPKDAEFFKRAADLEWSHAKIAAFGSTRRAGIRVEDDLNLTALLAARTPVCTLVGKSWDFHVKAALRTTLEENLRMIEESVAYLTAQGREVIFDAEHFFDGYKRNPEYALEALSAAQRGGARVIVLCDTNGGSLPHEIFEIVSLVCEGGGGKAPIGVHTHNDSGLGVANALMGVRAGAVHVQGTVNGYGERCGNADLVPIIANLQLKLGISVVSAEQLASLTELSHTVSELANLSPDPRQPFVGRSVFAHKGGIHVSAMLRHPETYEHLDPGLIGNQRRVLVSELSGASNVIYKAKEYGLSLEKDSPALRNVLQIIKEREHDGFHYEGAEASFELLLKKATGAYAPFFDLLGLRLIIEKRQPGEAPIAEATIKLQVGGSVIHTVAEGNGPVNALDSALRRALEAEYPLIRRIRLTDYKVRVLNEKAGTEAGVRVLISSADERGSWNTIGVSTDIIEASWQAIVDSIEYGLIAAGVASQHTERAVAL